MGQLFTVNKGSLTCTCDGMWPRLPNSVTEIWVVLSLLPFALFYR